MSLIFDHRCETSRQPVSVSAEVRNHASVPVMQPPLAFQSAPLWTRVVILPLRALRYQALDQPPYIGAAVAWTPVSPPRLDPELDGLPAVPPRADLGGTPRSRRARQ